MKTCPFSVQQMQDAAIKCRYCGSALDRDASSVAEKSAEPSITAAPDPSQQGTHIACEKCRSGVMEPVT